MDYEKIGKFIRDLRIKNEYSQNDLAEMIPIGRDAISKWENGKTIPDSQNLIILSRIFNITIDELMNGEYSTKSNKDEMDQIHLQIYDDRNNIKRELKSKTRFLLFVLFILLSSIISFLVYYFFNSYDSVKIYTIESMEKEINLSDGFLIMTGENIYFRLGNISIFSEKNISKVVVYWELDDEKHIVYERDNKFDILIRDYYGYEEYFTIENKKLLLDSLYVDITIDNSVRTIKLKMNEDYANKHIFFNRSNRITNINDETNVENNHFIDDKELINILTAKENVIQLNYENINYDIIFFEDSEMFVINWKENKNNYTFEHYLYDGSTSYIVENGNSKILKECSFNENENNCNKEIANKYIELLEEIKRSEGA